MTPPPGPRAAPGEVPAPAREAADERLPDRFPPIAWERACFQRCRGWGGPRVTRVMKVFAFLGREPLWLGVVAFWIFLFYSPPLFVLFGNVLFFEVVLVETTKAAIQRPRPYQLWPDVPPLESAHKSHGFPSGHTYVVTAYAVLTTYLTTAAGVAAFDLGTVIGGARGGSGGGEGNSRFGAGWPVAATVVLALAWGAVTVAVAFSRLQLGVHFALDVGAGFLLGVAGSGLSILVAPLWLGVIRDAEAWAADPRAGSWHAWNGYLAVWWYYLLLAAVYGGIVVAAVYKKVFRKPEAPRAPGTPGTPGTPGAPGAPGRGQGEV